MEDSRVAEMAQSDATQAHATAVPMRTYWIQKLGLATLQAVGVSQSDLQHLAEEMNLTTVQSKLEEHRRYWIHQPTDAENKRATALLDARFADAGLKALEGLYAEALEICDELLSNETEHGSSSIKSKTRVTGIKGLVHALKGEWQAAHNFLVRSIMQGFEQFLSSEGNGDFFFDYVVLTLGEALGYLLIHLVESDGSTRDSPQSSAILNPCDKSHALYPVVLFGLGLLGDGAKFEDTTCNVERLMVECARQLSRGRFGATPCLCSYAHEKVAIVLNESKNKDEERMVMADSFQLAESIHLAQSAGKSTQLESSCLDGLGDLGTEGGNPFLSLKTYSSALRLKLSLCAEIETDPEVQTFCQRLQEIILQILALEGKDGRQLPSPADSHPTDIMVYSLYIIAFLEKDQKLEALDEVVEAVSRFQHVIKDAEWMSKCLSELTKEYLNRDAYRKVAAIFLLRSNLSTNLEDKLALRTHEAGCLNKAGELKMALEVMKTVTRASMQLDESLWRTRALLYTSAASFFDEGGEIDAAIAAKEEACRIVCAHATSYEFNNHNFDLLLIKVMISLLQTYGRQRNWGAAYKLLDSMDAHIGRHYCNEPIWKTWQATKYTIASQRGDYDYASKLLRLHYPFPDGNIGTQSSIIFELRQKEQLMEDFANAGKWERAMKVTEKMLESIQKLSSPRDKHVEELAVRSNRCLLFSRWGKPTHALEEMEKVIVAVSFVEYQDVRESVRLEFVLCLCFLAIDCHKNGNVIESKRLMGLVKSKISRCNNALELAEVEFLEACMLDHDGKWKEAADKARLQILLLMEEQRRLCHLDHEPMSWLSFSHAYLNRKLWFIESLYCSRRLQSAIIGLVWAERSQQRFFMHQIYNQPKETAIPNPSDLDECDQLLTSLIFQTIKALRPKTSIIEYSYNLERKIINMYVVVMTPDGKDSFQFGKICHLPTWFEENGFKRNKSLQELIVASIDEEGPSIEALSILYAILIQFIEEYLKDCDSLIFVPGHGCLAKIPFAALYDGRHNKHIIADYNVAVVPSIVTLHRCLYRQYNFERYLEVVDQNLFQDSSSELGPSKQSLQFDGQSNLPRNVAFVAGNPKPMGCELPQLPGAEEEAKNVAAFFKVTPCVGKDMTKQAVIEGLTTSKVVLLATHGMVKEDYPHGCLVLQASSECQEVTPTSPLQSEMDKPPLDQAVASTSTSATLSPGLDMLTLNKQLNDFTLTSIATHKVNLTTTKLSKGKSIAKEQEQEQDVLQHDGHQEGKQSSMSRLFELSDAKTKQQRAKEAPQVLTAEEIVALKGGIHAGLVVLSACQSGLGEETASEGLLGLGKALLLGGAVSTILTLWEVNDVFTSRFMIDLFKELLIVEPRGRSVDECMRKVMLNMIREGQPLKHWAAFTIVGSPTLRLFKPNSSTWGVSGLDKHSYHVFGVDNCPYSCRVCEKRKEVLNSENSATIYDVSNIVDIENRRTVEAEELDEMFRRGARLQRLGNTNLYTITLKDGSFGYLSFGKMNVVKPPFK